MPDDALPYLIHSPGCGGLDPLTLCLCGNHIYVCNACILNAFIQRTPQIDIDFDFDFGQEPNKPR